MRCHQSHRAGFVRTFWNKHEDTLSFEAMARIQATLLLRDAPIRRSLQAVLRAIHYLEAERSVTVARRVLPVLDPYDWITPESRKGRRGAGL